MNNSNRPGLDNLRTLEAAAHQSGRQITYEEELLYQFLGIERKYDEEGMEITEELEGDRVFLSSAIPLTQDQKLRILRQFMRITNQEVRSFITIVDPSLIIGVRIQSERFYYELSGQHTLRSMNEQIKLSNSEEVSS